MAMTAVEIKSRLWELGQVVQAAQQEATKLYGELKQLEYPTPAPIPAPEVK